MSLARNFHESWQTPLQHVSLKSMVCESDVSHADDAPPTALFLEAGKSMESWRASSRLQRHEASEQTNYSKCMCFAVKNERNREFVGNAKSTLRFPRLPFVQQVIGNGRQSLSGTFHLTTPLFAFSIAVDREREQIIMWGAFFRKKLEFSFFFSKKSSPHYDLLSFPINCYSKRKKWCR